MKTLFLSLLLLSGCASLRGVTADDDERKACADQGCTVWTVQELGRLARKFFNEGYRAGKESI